MGEIMENIVIANLQEGNIFDRDELIIKIWDDGMRTIRKEPDFDEIRYFGYDWRPDGKECSIHNHGYEEIYPEDADYEDYKKRLIEKGLWQ